MLNYRLTFKDWEQLPISLGGVIAAEIYYSTDSRCGAHILGWDFPISESQLVHISLLRLILANLDRDSEAMMVYPWSNAKAKQIMADMKNLNQRSEEAKALSDMSSEQKQAYRDYLNRNSAFANIRTAHERS